MHFYGGDCMLTVLKVREHIDTNEVPGWFTHPPGTVEERI